MEIFAFILIGVTTGVGSALMLLRFDAGWLKAFSLSGGAAILIGEFLAFSELLSITPDNRAVMLVSLLAAWLITFSSVLYCLLKSFKGQETKYKIQTWEILLGDKKTIDHYYNAKKEEITKKIEGEYNFDRLKTLKASTDVDLKRLEVEKISMLELKEEADEILSKKHTVTIPLDYKFPIKREFFSLLPRYIQSVSEFALHLSLFTDSFIAETREREDRPNDDEELLKTYLTGLSYYVGQHLFNWRDVRVHFRIYNSENKSYDKYVAVHKSGEDYSDTLTPIPADLGLICLAIKSKRSIVFSANRQEAFETGSDHIWKDYITMVFEKLHIKDMPILSLGISVKHFADHKDMLYFLSFIQIEQIIQENLMKFDKEVAITNLTFPEVA